MPALGGLAERAAAPTGVVTGTVRVSAGGAWAVSALARATLAGGTAHGVVAASKRNSRRSVALTSSGVNRRSTTGRGTTGQGTTETPTRASVAGSTSGTSHRPVRRLSAVIGAQRAKINRGITRALPR